MRSIHEDYIHKERERERVRKKKIQKKEEYIDITVNIHK